MKKKVDYLENKYSELTFGKLLKKIFTYLKEDKKYIVLSFILIILSAACELSYPIMMKHFVNNLPLENSSLKLIIGFALGYLGLYLIGQIFLVIESRTMEKVGQNAIYKIRMEVFDHIQTLSYEQLNQIPVGSLVTRVANYTSSMSDLFTKVLLSLGKDIIMAFLSVGLMFILSVPLALYMLIFLFTVLVISLVFAIKVKKIFDKDRSEVSSLNAFLNETLTGMKTIQTHNKEDLKKAEFDEHNNNLKKIRYNLCFAYTMYRPLVNFIYYLAIAFTFYIGIKISLKAGDVTAFYLSLSNFFNPVQRIADQLSNIQKAMTSSERLFSLLDLKSEVVDYPDALEIDNFKGKIEFKNVWFKYDEEWILKDVSFVINPKNSVAFVGATGSGKSTILSLIVRNYDIQKGQILIDDIDIKKIKISSLRKNIGQMMQNVFLFNGTITENITLHDNKFSFDEVKQSAFFVNADMVTDSFEDHYNHKLSDNGENLSTGQRQLISFARTVIHKPKVLILDEATSSIDTETENVIQQSLNNMKSIGTMIVVAHRLSTIEKSDCIYVLKNGEIVESGTHKELLSNQNVYYNLYKIQADTR